jgi:hypothetical protein
VLSGFRAATQLATRYLAPRHLQFLQPPSALSELIGQTVCTSIEPSVMDDVAQEITLGADTRRALVTHAVVVRALETARDNPLQLTIEQRDLLHRVFPFLTTRDPSVIPIAFADPFAGHGTTRRGDLNLLHSFGQGFCRALGALGIAESEQEFTALELEKLHRDCMKHAIVGREALLTFDVKTFSERLFKVIKDRGFLPGYEPPRFPEANEFVPSFARPATVDMISFRGRYMLNLPLGKFGSLIRTWP